jgi:hypothetical protein
MRRFGARQSLCDTVFAQYCYATLLPKAGMAELADAADSKSADLRVMGVRPPLPAPALNSSRSIYFTAPSRRAGAGGVAVYPQRKPHPMLTASRCAESPCARNAIRRRTRRRNESKSTSLSARWGVSTVIRHLPRAGLYLKDAPPGRGLNGMDKYKNAT